MADGGLQSSILIVKHDGSIDFSINQKIAVQESVKYLVSLESLEGAIIRFSLLSFF